jgi:hypothetical protein
VLDNHHRAATHMWYSRPRVQFAWLVTPCIAACVFLYHAASTLPSGGCTSPNSYTLAGDNSCRTCPDNATALPDKDGCMCKDGYAPAIGTSLQAGNLSCQACLPGTCARAGDLACAKCPDGLVSSDNSATCGECSSKEDVTSFRLDADTFSTYRTGFRANAAQSACDCVILRLASLFSMRCTTVGAGTLAACNCTNPTRKDGTQETGEFSTQVLLEHASTCQHVSYSSFTTKFVRFNAYMTRWHVSSYNSMRIKQAIAVIRVIVLKAVTSAHDKIFP